MGRSVTCFTHEGRWIISEGGNARTAVGMRKLYESRIHTCFIGGGFYRGLLIICCNDHDEGPWIICNVVGVGSFYRWENPFWPRTSSHLVYLSISCEKTLIILFCIDFSDYFDQSQVESQSKDDSCDIPDGWGVISFPTFIRSLVPSRIICYDAQEGNNNGKLNF